MKNGICSIMVIFVLSGVSVYAQNSGVGERYTESAGGYSICPPTLWQVVEFPGLKYHVFMGPVSNGFTPNINFVDEQAAVPLKEYVDLSVTGIQQFFEDFVLVSRSKFLTNNNEAGERLVIFNKQYSLRLKQVFYFFSKNNAKMVITCTVNADSGELYDAVFDESIKTFRW